MNNLAIIFAGGTGQRLRNAGINIPKQFIEVNGKPIIVYTLEIFQTHPKIDKIYIAIHPEYCDLMKKLIADYRLTKVAGMIPGGATGQESIYKALKLARQDNAGDSIVLIHDGVRPNVTPEVISRNIDMARDKGNAVTTIGCFETILISEDGNVPSVVPIRKHTFIAQAPQTFKLDDILEAHEIMRRTNPQYDDIVDSCTLFQKLGKQTHMVEGNRGNIKITTIEDLYILRAYISYNEDLVNYNLK